MLRLMLLVPAAALLAVGGEGLYRAMAASTELATTCGQIAGARPSAPRIRVTGCDLDYVGAAYRESGGHIDELFFPARPAGATTGAAPLVVVTRDPDAVAIAQTVLGGGRRPPAEQSIATMQKVAAALDLAPGIEGVSRTGYIDRYRARRVISGFSTPVADDALIIDLGGRPDFKSPLLALAAGGLLALFPWLFSRRSTPKPQPGEPAGEAPSEARTPSDGGDGPAGDRFSSASEGHAPAEVNDQMAAQRVSVELPGLLLLNIDVRSGPEAIETAPPLGTRTDVVAILSGVIPDATIDDRRHVLRRQDGSITLKLGELDPIPTVVVQARGEAGVALVKEVLLMTGWRAFAPKTGLFIEIEDLDALGALAGGGDSKDV